MNNNDVCFVSTVNTISPIAGADKIELVTVSGYSSIVTKGQYEIGTRVVVFTQDAIIPREIADKFGFTNYLRVRNQVPDINPKKSTAPHLVVKTIKLKGVYSECILLGVKDIDFKPLNIQKYEEPILVVQGPGGVKIRVDKKNPNFLVYHKFPNYKKVPQMFQSQDQVVVTRKIHGTNARFGIVRKTTFSWWERLMIWLDAGIHVKAYTYIIGSHNVQKNSNSKGYYTADYWQIISDRYNIKRQLSDLYITKGTGIILFGEIYGKGIQKGYGYGLDGIDVAFFDMTVDGKYVSREQFLQYTSYMNLPIVEPLYIGHFENCNIDYLLNQKIGYSKTPHEGIVIADPSGDRSRVAKVINNDYLIHNEAIDGTDHH